MLDSALNIQSIIPLISEKIMWFAVVVVILVFFVMFLVFKHHWNYYGIDKKNRVFVRLLYTTGSFLILLSLSAIAFIY